MTKNDNKDLKNNETKDQLEILKKRVLYIKRMQVFGILSFIFCLFTIICLYIELDNIANYFFGLALFLLVASLLFALVETLQSTEALSIHLKNSNY